MRRIICKSVKGGKYVKGGGKKICIVSPTF